MEEGTNNFMVCGNRFDVDKRYSLIKPIGQGAYGIVCSAHDLKTEKKTAIKKIARAFDNVTDCKRTLREIKLLRHFSHENVLSLSDILKPQSYANFDDVYLVCELLDTDLHQIINSPQHLSEDHCQYFMYQILRGLKYIHSADVMHRDLKPSNILLNGNCDLKICDFGLARVAAPEANHTGFYTEYVATRWYRAPEIILSWKEYTKAVDLWSVGCIFVEILLRKPLFPGKTYIHQLQLITDILGTPPESDLDEIASPKARQFLNLLPNKPKVPFRQLIPRASPIVIDLCEKLLSFNAKKRITAEEALKHPYLAQLHDPTDEPVATSRFDFSWEEVAVTKELLKELTFKEMLSFHPEAASDPTYTPMLPDVLDSRTVQEIKKRHNIASSDANDEPDFDKMDTSI